MILVTGGTGYIGSHTAVELLSAGKDIVILDNLSNSSIDAVEKIKQITGRDFKFYECDLLNKDAVDAVFSENAIDSVVHFAGLKAVGESVELPLLYYHNNITGTLNLCEVMAKHNVKKIVFSSSATVYGDPASVPIDESFPLSATNPYGRTKLMIEEILRDLYVSDDGWGIVLLRYFNPIGAHESGVIGENPSGIPNNLLPFVARVAAGKLPVLNVYGNDYNTVDGTGVRDYIHVVDLSLGHLKALGKIENERGVHTYNLGTGNGYSVLQIIKAFEEASGKSVNYQIAARRAGDIAECYANPQKAQDELNWRALRDLNKMCIDSWNFIKNN